MIRYFNKYACQMIDFVLILNQNLLLIREKKNHIFINSTTCRGVEYYVELNNKDIAFICDFSLFFKHTGGRYIYDLHYF